VAAAAIAVALPTVAGASDHLDAPGLTSPGGGGQTDVADLYAFQSAQNPDNAVLIATFNPLAGNASPETLATDVVYSFQVDNDGDAVVDIMLNAVVGEPAEDTQPILLASSDGSRLFPTIHAVTWDGAAGQAIGDSGWLGLDVYDDPFFFDLGGFTGEEDRAFCDGNGSDFFAGSNVTGIVVELPRTALGADQVGVWVTTRQDGTQIDRVGRPAINTVFIKGDAKNDYNAAAPGDDPETYAEALGELASVLLPDVLTVDLTDPAGFLNGRGLANDVIDTELQVITGDETAGDCVDANDVAFSDSAPFLARAHEG
jgi:hypothetical protein